MSDESDFEIPEDIAALIPDVAVSDEEIEQNPLKDTPDQIKQFSKDVVERAKEIPNAPIAPNGLFKHPPNFTNEEWNIIIDGIQHFLPLYMIARKVNCSRHFLSRKIAEVPEIAQMVVDARQGIVDIAETQLLKYAQQGSVAATIHILDHLGVDRGWGQQGDPNKGQTEDVQITFGEISKADLEEAKHTIEEANKKVTPTLAGELAQIEVPKSASAQDLAFAEDMVKSIEKATEPKATNLPSPVVSPPPYQKSPEENSKYDFLETAFSEGGESPFAFM